MLKYVRIIAGVLIWLVLICFLWGQGTTWLAGSGGDSLRQVSAFVLVPRDSIVLEFEFKKSLRIGDPIYTENEQGDLIQIGAIRQLESQESHAYTSYTDWAEATLFSTAPDIDPGDYFTYHETPTSMDWVLQMMLSPEKRAEIAGLIADVYMDNRQELFAELNPILESTFREAGAVIRDEIVKSIVKRQSNWEQIADRYRVELLEEEIIPLVNQEIWPIVRHHLQPLLERIGEEIWQRSSFWRFGWRALYDVTPLPQRDLTKSEFNRFMREEAVPIMTRYLPDFLRLQQRILRDIAANQRVQAVVNSSFKQVINDRELQRLALEILEEVFVNNAELTAAFHNIWNSPETQKFLELTDARLEPTVVDIGEALFGSPSGGVTDEFARVLRNKVLRKDWRWLVLRHQDPSSPVSMQPGVSTVLDGETTTENPFFFPARERK